MSRVTIITPTYKNDLERFILLRESFERCGVDIPHVAVVHDEDMPLFKDIPFRNNLRLVSTREVLPASIEERRITPFYRRRHPYHWIKPRNLSGWATQQIAKLNAPTYVDTEAIVTLDSDTFFVDRVQDSEFFAADGNLHLYEDDAGFTVEVIRWLSQSMEVFNQPLNQPAYRHIFQPLPMHCEVMRSMTDRLEAMYGKPWYDVFIHKNLTEYTTYGVYCRFVNDMKHVTPVYPPFSLIYWIGDHLEGYSDTLPQRVRAEGAKVVCINSAIGRPVGEYREVVESVWQANGR
jgi:hypothetical protein